MSANQKLKRSLTRSLAVVGTVAVMGFGLACSESPVVPGKFTGSAHHRKKPVEPPITDAGVDAFTLCDAGCSDGAPPPPPSSPSDASSWTPTEDANASEPPPPEEEPPPPPPPQEQPPQLPQGSASWLIQSGDAVFFVGNSFLGGDNSRIADLIPVLGSNMSPPFTIRTGQHVVYGNYPLSWFFQQPESQDAIHSGQYEIFVLQGEDREPVDHPDQFKQAVHDYYNAVTANGGRIMLFMTWDFYWERDTDFFARLSATYDALGQELNVPVIPVGLIYDDCNKQPYGDFQPYSYWLTSQQLHQNDMGTAVNVYATFAMLTGINPQGMLFVAPWMNTLPPDLLKYLSDMSWARVAPRLGL